MEGLENVGVGSAFLEALSNGREEQCMCDPRRESVIHSFEKCLCITRVTDTVPRLKELSQFEGKLRKDKKTNNLHVMR